MNATLVILAILFVGCGAPATSTQLENQAPGPPVALIRRAEDALAESLRPDLRRPFLSPRYSPSEVRDRYFEACKAGDRQSCWIAVTVAGEAVPPALLAVIRGNCLTGDLMSCRGLPVGQWGNELDGAPGERGRSKACMTSDGWGCDPKELRRECKAGFALSCYRVLLVFCPPDWETLKVRTAFLAREGCKAGIGGECSVLGRVPDISDDDNRLEAEQRCTLARYCAFLFRRYDRLGDRVRAAAMYERACQYEDEPWWNCLWLATKYLDGEFPEPVAGRGQALIEWVCTHSAMVRNINETCKLARTTSHLGKWEELPR